MQSEQSLATTGVSLNTKLLNALRAKARSLRRSVSGLLEEWIRQELKRK